MRESLFELGHPDLDDVHLRGTAKAVADVEVGRPVDVAEIIPQKVVRVPRQVIATENQSLGLFIRNSGGVSIEQAGVLRGEALFESGGRASGVVKRKAGRSPDELAQAAHESGFIDEPGASARAWR